MVNKLIPICLAASVLLTPVSVLANAAQKRVHTLLKQQPWDKQQLRKIISLSLMHDHLRSAKPPGWEEQVHAIASNPDFVPDAKQVFEDSLVSLPFADQQIEKLLLWKMIDPQGKQHWLFGTIHHLTFANFTPQARAQLEQLIDASSAILHENVQAGSIDLAQALLDSMGYDEMIDKLVQLDGQIIARGIYRHKKIVALEDPYDRLIIRNKLAKLRRILFYKVSRLRFLFKKEIPREQVAHAIVEDLAKHLSALTAYRTADVSALNLGEFIPNITSDDINARILNARNHLWLDRIITQCEQNDSCLIVAGHAHMTHDSKNIKSIITLLRERGFIIEFAE